MQASQTHFGSPARGQKCTFSESWPFELAKFDLGHPVKMRVVPKPLIQSLKLAQQAKGGDQRLVHFLVFQLNKCKKRGAILHFENGESSFIYVYTFMSLSCLLLLSDKN